MFDRRCFYWDFTTFFLSTSEIDLLKSSERKDIEWKYLTRISGKGRGGAVRIVSPSSSSVMTSWSTGATAIRRCFHCNIQHLNFWIIKLTFTSFIIATAHFSFISATAHSSITSRIRNNL